jgi:uncharacterized protein (DUF1330 family)
MTRLSRIPLLLGVLFAVTGCPKKDADPKDKGTDAVRLPSPPADFTLGAVDLAKEYEADPKAADLKYKGKWLLVEGKVSDVVLGYADDVTVVLRGFNKDPKKAILGHSARCHLNKDDTARAANLTKGQKVTVKGECNGGALAFFIDLLKGELVEVGPDPAVVVAAEQLAKDFGADATAAKAKYGGKWLALTGTVVEVKTGEKGADYVVLEGTEGKDGKPLRVEAAYPAEGKRFFEKLGKGDKVTIKGECSGYRAGAVAVNYSRLISGN